MEQNLRKLKVDKKKKSKVEIAYTAVVGFYNALNFYLLPLSGFFNFKFIQTLFHQMVLFRLYLLTNLFKTD